MAGPDLETVGDRERGYDRITGIGVLVGITAAVLAAAAMWLMLTEPVAVVNAVDEGQISPLVVRLAEVIYNAISGLLAYL